MPYKRCGAYVAGVSRWLAWHAIALRAVRLRFEVRAPVLLRTPGVVVYEHILRYLIAWACALCHRGL